MPQEKKDAHTLGRAEQVPSKRSAFSRMLFILLLILVFVFIIYWLTGQSHYNKNRFTAVYPHWKKQLSFLNECGISWTNDPILKVKNLETYLVGSYIEHRQKEKIIRTISIMLRSQNTKYYCLLCCSGSIISVEATFDIHSDHFGFEYGATDIFCPLLETCTEPTHVAISSQSPEEDGSSQDIHTFLPVRNQKKQEIFPHEFTVCISVMFEYTNVLMLVQAMEMFKILGVQKVAVYKTSCHPDVQKVLDYYVKQNFVELIPWSITSYVNVSRSWQKSISPGELHYFGQIAALNDCVYRYMYQSHYVSLQDLDEFILPLNLNTWNELLPELERKYNPEMGFEFETYCFPFSITDSQPEYSPESWKNVTGVNILEHIYRLSNDPKFFNGFKIIVNPRVVFRATVHGLLQSVRGTVRVDSNIAHIYHMRDVSKDFISKYSRTLDPRPRYYADRLIPAVSNVLQQALDIQPIHANTTS